MVMQMMTPRVWIFDSAPSGEEDQLMAIRAQSAYPRIKKQKRCLFSLPRRQVRRGSLQSVMPSALRQSPPSPFFQMHAMESIPIWLHSFHSSLSLSSSILHAISPSRWCWTAGFGAQPFSFNASRLSIHFLATTESSSPINSKAMPFQTWRENALTSITIITIPSPSS